MGDSRVQVNLRVSESQKERWDEYVAESPEYNSLSNLIRAAVEHEIAAEGSSQGNNPQGSASDERLGELLTAVEKMQGRMDDLEATVMDATDALHTAGTNDGMAAAVYEELPSSATNALTAEQIAEELAVSTPEARVALENLKKNTGVVKKIEAQQAGGSSPLWFKEA